MPQPVNGLTPPSRGTLAKYGLSASDWFLICSRQCFKCPVCSEPLGDRPLAIDHAHVKGFKARRRLRSGRRVRVMKQEERATHVRGVLHSYCNRQVRRWLTLPLARAIVRYLEDYELRRAVQEGTS